MDRVKFFKEKIKEEMVECPIELVEHIIEYTDVLFQEINSIQFNDAQGVIVSSSYNSAIGINRRDHPEEFEEVMGFLMEMVEVYSI